MKKILFSLAGVVFAAAFSYGQACEDFNDGPYTNFNSSFGGAPCSETPPVTNEITGFEVWKSEAYLMGNIKAGGQYTFSACNSVAGPNTGGQAWVLDFTIVAPSGAVDAFGLDAGSDCALSWTASETGEYTIIVNEAGNCGATTNLTIDNGYPAITYNGGATCDPPVTECEAGVNEGVDPASICPGESTTLTISGVVVPNSPTPGDAFIEFTPTDPNNTSGLGGEFVLTGFTAEDLNGYVFNNDLNGVLSGNGFPVLEGEWEIKGFVTSVAGDYFNPATRCDSTDGVATITFLGPTDPGCTPVTTCEAGTINSGEIAMTLCPEETTDVSITGITVPNDQSGSVFFVAFSTETGAGGPFVGEPDPSFVVTFGAVNPGSENVDAIFTLSPTLIELLGTAFAPLEGEWTIQGLVFDSETATEPCDVTDLVTVDFRTADQFPCGGPAPCENPYPAVDVASLNWTENPNGSLTFSWASIPGQIGCQVQIGIGTPQSPSASATQIVGGVNANSFVVPPQFVTPFTTYFARVRCGCQQFPEIIAGPYTPFSNYVTGLGITADTETKLEVARTGNNNTARIQVPVDRFAGIGVSQNSVRKLNRTEAETANAQFEVFPNPTEGLVNFDYSADANGFVNVRVFDMLGKAVADHTVAVNEGRNLIDIDLSAYEAGIYLIEVREGNKTSTSRVMLK